MMLYTPEQSERPASKRGRSSGFRSTSPLIYERLSRSTFTLYSVLCRILSAHIWNPFFIDELQQVILHQTQTDTYIWLDNIKTISSAQFASKTTETRLIAVIEIEPLAHYILLELDDHCAKRIINCLLGVSREKDINLGPFSEIELGIFSYFLLKVLFHFQGNPSTTPTTSLRLKDIRRHPQECLHTMPSTDGWMMIQWHIKLGGTLGYAIIYIPLSLAKSCVVERRIVSQLELPNYSALTKLRSHRIRGLNFTAKVFVGVILLSQTEWRNLECGDIVLLGDTHLQHQKPNLISGPATLKFRPTGQACIYGHCSRSGNQYHFRIEHLSSDEVESAMKEHQHNSQTLEPTAYPKVGKQAPAVTRTPSSIPKSSTSTLDTKTTRTILSELPVSLSIEIGQIELSADQILQLHPGQIINLNIASDNLISLNLGDQTLAQAELVEIDEQLGARILTIKDENV